MIVMMMMIMMTTIIVMMTNSIQGEARWIIGTTALVLIFSFCGENSFKSSYFRSTGCHSTCKLSPSIWPHCQSSWFLCIYTAGWERSLRTQSFLAQEQNTMIVTHAQTLAAQYRVQTKRYQSDLFTCGPIMTRNL